MTWRRRLHGALAPLIYSDRFALVPAGVNVHWPRRRFLRRLLRELQVDCVFDVGANVGQYGAELRLIGYRGLILSFEPAATSFAALKHNSAADPGWHVFNIAFGNSTGVAELHEMTNSVFNSLLAPSTDETDMFKRGNTVARTAAVDIDTLANVVPDLQQHFGFRRPFLKMDTQGYDLEVFRGGGASLSSFVGLQSEVAVKRIYSGAPTWSEAIAAYQAKGFMLVDLYPVTPRLTEKVEFDCFMVRPAGRPTTEYP